MTDETPGNLKEYLLQQNGKLAATEHMLILLTRIVANNIPGTADDLERCIDHVIAENPDLPPSFPAELQKLRGLIRNPPPGG